MKQHVVENKSLAWFYEVTIHVGGLVSVQTNFPVQKFSVIQCTSSYGGQSTPHEPYSASLVLQKLCMLNVGYQVPSFAMRWLFSQEENTE